MALISERDLKERRTPSALREYVLALKDCVSQNPTQFTRALLKRGLYKQFLDELVPLSCFAVMAYPKIHPSSCCWGISHMTRLSTTPREMKRIGSS